MWSRRSNLFLGNRKYFIYLFITRRRQVQSGGGSPLWGGNDCQGKVACTRGQRWVHPRTGTLHRVTGPPKQQTYPGRTTTDLCTSLHKSRNSRFVQVCTGAPGSHDSTLFEFCVMYVVGLAELRGPSHHSLAATGPDKPKSADWQPARLGQVSNEGRPGCGRPVVTRVSLL